MNLLKTTMCASALTIGMTACGGGGSAPTPSTPAPITAQASDELVGTWADSSCQKSTVVTAASDQANAGAFVNQKRQFVMTKTGASTLNATVITKFYAPADTNCTGTVLRTETRDNQTITVGGSTKSLDWNRGVLGISKVTATKLNNSGAAVGGISGGVSVTFGSLTFPGNYFVVATNDDYYIYIYESGKLVYGTAAATTLGSASLIKGAAF